jgi:hypothetical protein
VSNLQSVVLTLALSYALIGALLLIVLVYARLHWSAKAIAVVVTSAFYIAKLCRGARLLGWATIDRLLSVQIAAGPYRRAAFAGRRSGAIYLWVETSTKATGTGGPGPTASLPEAARPTRPTRRDRRRPCPGRPRRRFRRRPAAAGGRPGVHHPQHIWRRRAAIPRRGAGCWPRVRATSVVYAAAYRRECRQDVEQ